jgi:hypothetical protein
MAKVKKGTSEVKVEEAIAQLTLNGVKLPPHVGTELHALLGCDYC